MRSRFPRREDVDGKIIFKFYILRESFVISTKLIDQ